MSDKEFTAPVGMQEAISLFRRLGIDVAGMTGEAVKAARRELLYRHHPDRGGDVDTAQLINAAYDLLKNGVPDRTFYDSNLDLYEAHKLKNPGCPEWVWAGHAGGIPDSTIYQNDFSDINFIKKSIWELSRHSLTEYTIWGFDGQQFQGISVFGSPKTFSYMTTAMITWLVKQGRQCSSVLVGKADDKELLVTYAQGQYHTEQPLRIVHSSFNSNPGNDPSFESKLTEVLQRVNERTAGR
jgi:hypothetical protein